MTVDYTAVAIAAALEQRNPSSSARNTMTPDYTAAALAALEYRNQRAALKQAFFDAVETLKSARWDDESEAIQDLLRAYKAARDAEAL